jgi:hypothetical protein
MSQAPKLDEKEAATVAYVLSQSLRGLRDRLSAEASDQGSLAFIQSTLEAFPSSSQEAQAWEQVQEIRETMDKASKLLRDAAQNLLRLSKVGA